ncbi:hypothetical protein [Faecalicatena contorta]|uniref:hypothetical protein n=1 Tax=Faecalicatena contorta TaxID=39482 RepID=UPI0031DAAA83
MKVRPPQVWQAGTAGEVSGGFDGCPFAAGCVLQIGRKNRLHGGSWRGRRI